MISAQDDSFAKYQEFIQKYGKKFTSLDDLTKRYQAYQSNMGHVARLNAENPNDEGQESTYGETEFSDMEPEEFQKQYLTFTLPATQNTQTTEDSSFLASNSEPTTDNTDSDSGRNLQSIPLSWDWRTKGAVGPVKNQGSCGACWSFAAVGNLEGLYYRKYGVMKNFSEQQLIDCSIGNNGCGGGFMEKAFSYIQSAGGLEQTADYGSYRQYKKTCSFNRNKAILKVKSWTFVGSNEVTMRNYVYNNGPIAVALNANPLQYYRGGIVNVSCSTAVNHGVTLVGYGSSNGLDYWIVKNSWGASWGESGFFRIRRGIGMCGINTYVVSAILA